MAVMLLFLAFMLGLSLLLPWNCLLKSLPYIVTRVPKEWRSSASLWLTLTFTLTNCMVLLLMTLTDVDSKLVRRLCKGRATTERVIGIRLYTGLLGCSLLLGLACIGPIVEFYQNGDKSGVGSYGMLVLFWGIFVCTGWLMCLLQRSVYPLLALLPGRKDQMIPTMLTGQAIAGISASLGSFLFSSEKSNDAAIMIIGYLLTCITALLSTAVLFRSYNGKKQKGSNASKDDATSISKPALVTFVPESEKFSLRILRETAQLIQPWPQLLSLNFAITISFFPSLLTSGAVSMSDKDAWMSKYFVSLTFLIFDLFDLLGKVMPSLTGPCGLGPRSLMGKLFAPTRLLLIPAFLLLPNMGLMRVFLNIGDLGYFLVLAVFAWTSGWGNAICLINGPLIASEQRGDLNDGLGDRIGSLMGFSITFGLMSGSALSFVLKHFLLNNNQ